MDSSKWASTRKVEVVVATKGPDGVEDRFTVTASREVYALSRAAILHAEKHGCDDIEVLVREISSREVSR